MTYRIKSLVLTHPNKMESLRGNIVILLELIFVSWLDASIPTKFWSFIFATVVFLINHLPSQNLQNKFSFECIFQHTHVITLTSKVYLLFLLINELTSYTQTSKELVWQKVMQEEYNALIVRGIWLLLIYLLKKAIGCKRCV